MKKTEQKATDVLASLCRRIARGEEHLAALARALEAKVKGHPPVVRPPVEKPVAAPRRAYFSEPMNPERGHIYDIVRGALDRRFGE